MSLFKKYFCVAIEETIFCPVSYVRLISFMRKVNIEYEFRLFELPKHNLDAKKYLKNASALYLARSVSKVSFELAVQAKSQNIPILFDIDDYLWRLPQYLESIKCSHYLDRILNLVTVVTTPSESLKSYIQNNRPHLKIEILPNPGDILKCSETKPVLKLVLANSDVFRLPNMRSDFFKSLSIAALQNKQPTILYYFSNDLPDQSTDDIYFKIIFAGIRSLSSYKQLLNWIKPDLALVPLPDDYFSKYKSVIKFAEFGSEGIPSIFSNVEPYRSFVNNQIDGWLVDNNFQSWQKLLSELMQDFEKIKVVAKNVQIRSQKEFSESQIYEKWISILGQIKMQPQALEIQLGHPVPTETHFILQESYQAPLDQIKNGQWLQWAITNPKFLIKQFFKQIAKKFLHILRFFFQ